LWSGTEAAKGRAEHSGPNDVPRWNLSSLYAGFNSPDWIDEKARASKELEEFQAELSSYESNEAALDTAGLMKILTDLGSVQARISSLYNYAYAAFSVATDNAEASRELGRIEELSVPLSPLLSRFRQILVKNRSLITALDDEMQKSWAPLLEYWADLASHQMSAPEEELLSDLSRNGADAFSRLQERLVAGLSCTWEDGTKKTLVDLRNLAHHPDRDKRRKAWEAEIKLLQSQETAFAAALNGIKGWAQTLYTRRKWNSVLEASAAQSRINLKSLEGLIGGIREHLPEFQGFYSLKAQALGVKKLAFYDIFAPLPSNNRSWSFSEAAQFIVQTFSKFSQNLGDFAQKAFEKGWIDAEPRAGKVGGAYCIDYPVQGECRIMCNFSGSTDSVLTLAHELGHAWHSSLLNEKAQLQKEYPMTLAETASLFAETLIFNEILKSCEPSEAVALLEQRLSDLGQVLVDILSRFDFESGVFALKESQDPGAQDFNELMTNVQKEAYGPALDTELQHPYMWAVKGHYYQAELNFYNYPYAFGQLLSLSFYEQYKRDPEGFPQKYIEFLQSSGTLSCEDAAKILGADIETKEFWASSLKLAVLEIQRFGQNLNS